MIAVLTTLMVLVELLNFQTIPHIFLWEKGHHGNKRLHKVCGHVSVTVVRSRDVKPVSGVFCLLYVGAENAFRRPASPLRCRKREAKGHNTQQETQTAGRGHGIVWPATSTNTPLVISTLSSFLLCRDFTFVHKCTSMV